MAAAPRKGAPAVSRRVVGASLAGTIVLAAGAFVLSFASLTDLAKLAGINPRLAWIWPLIVDGLIVVATMSIVALAGHGRRALVYPWSLLAGGALVSVAANALHAILAAAGVVPALVSALVASVPPVVLLAVTHLSVVLVQRSAEPIAKPKKGRRVAGPVGAAAHERELRRLAGVVEELEDAADVAAAQAALAEGGERISLEELEEDVADVAAARAALAEGGERISLEGLRAELAAS